MVQVKLGTYPSYGQVCWKSSSRNLS